MCVLAAIAFVVATQTLVPYLKADRQTYDKQNVSTTAQGEVELSDLSALTRSDLRRGNKTLLANEIAITSVTINSSFSPTTSYIGERYDVTNGIYLTNATIRKNNFLPKNEDSIDHVYSPNVSHLNGNSLERIYNNVARTANSSTLYQMSLKSENTNVSTIGEIIEHNNYDFDQEYGKNNKQSSLNVLKRWLEKQSLEESANKPQVQEYLSNFQKFTKRRKYSMNFVKNLDVNVSTISEIRENDLFDPHFLNGSVRVLGLFEHGAETFNKSLAINEQQQANQSVYEIRSLLDNNNHTEIVENAPNDILVKMGFSFVSNIVANPLINISTPAVNKHSIQDNIPTPPRMEVEKSPTTADPVTVISEGESRIQNKKRLVTESAHPSDPWPVKLAAEVPGDLILGGLMMVHEREESVTCGPIMPQGGIQALETMLYTLDVVNNMPGAAFTIGAHILDDCDKDTYGLEMAVDFIKGE